MKKILFLFAVVVFVAVIYLIKSSGDNVQKRYSVGIVSLTEVDTITINGFKTKLSELGYVEGDNIIYHNDGPIVNIHANFQKRVESLKKNKLDLIFVSSTPASVAVKKVFQSSGVPILFCPVSDPVGSGLVADLKHPKGNITGVKLVNGEAQRFNWLMEVNPQVKTVFIPYTQADKSAISTIKEITSTAEELEVNIISKGFNEKVKDESVLLSVPEKTDAIFMPRDSRMESRIDAFVSYTLKYKISLSAPSFLQAEKGALFSYGHVHFMLGLQAGRMAHQILSGIEPSHLPVELAENQFILNLVTAKKIGVEVPDFIIKQADKVIRE